MHPRHLLVTGVLLLGLAALPACAPANQTTSTYRPPTSAPTDAGPAAGSAPTEALPQAPQESPTTAAAEAAPSDTPSVTHLPNVQKAQAIPDPGTAEWAQVAAGLEKPVGFAFPTDDSGRVMVLEQPGRIRVVQGDQLLPEPFLDIVDRVGSGGFEQGLLGLAFHPQYAENGQFYINYTDKNGDTVIARYQVSGADANRADPDSEQVLLQVDQPYPNHNGGGVEFGPDGFLYLSLGDGGSAGDPQNNGQNPATLLGKLLRIDVNQGERYAVPPDNPFVGGGGAPEVWAYGLRNPWRFTFDRLTGDLYIADVGQNQWEEINFQAAGTPGGVNYGWKLREGAHPYQDAAPIEGLVDPVWEYNHQEGGCSVTGGVVVRDPALPAWQGVYLYGDYCTGKLWGLLNSGQAWQSGLLYETGFSITAFGEDQAGRVFLADHKGGVYVLRGK